MPELLPGSRQVTSMIKRFLIAIVFLALIGGGLVYFNIFRDKLIAQIFANLPVTAMPVSVEDVTLSQWHPVIDAIGSVKAAQGVDLTVEVAGVVTDVNFASNDKVSAGQLLLQMDDVQQAADLDAAGAELELQKANLDRATRLQGRGVTADANFDATKAAARAAEAQVARATALLEQRRLVAPFAGTIGLPQVDPGDYVAPGTMVATLQDLDRLHVDFTLPEQRLPDISISQVLKVRADGIDREFAGTITGIDPSVDTATRMVAVRGAITNTGGLLTPGQFVRITIEQPVEHDVIALSQTAVISSLYGDYVYVLRPREPGPNEGEDAPKFQVRQVFVKTGRRGLGVVEITGDTLKPGDRVVTAGQNRLANETAVSVDNSVVPVSPQVPGLEPEASPAADPAIAPQKASLGQAAAAEPATGATAQEATE